MVDQWRSDVARRDREVRVADRAAPASAAQDDDTLTVLFLCCHPVLTPASAIALTLRAVGGLTTARDRARVPRRRSRRWRSGSAGPSSGVAGERFSMPTPEERPARLRSVLHVLYLMFNEGYTDLADRHGPVRRGDPDRAAACTRPTTTPRWPACSRSCS